MTAHELQAKAARVADLLLEAEELLREITAEPAPDDLEPMLEAEAPFSVVGHVWSQAEAELDNRNLTAERIRWQDAATVTAEELARRWREDDGGAWRRDLELLDELPVA